MVGGKNGTGAGTGTGSGVGAGVGAGAGTGGGAGAGAEWIEASAEAWMSVTYAEFYCLMVENKLLPEQWRTYCADIARALLSAGLGGAGTGAGRMYACFALQAGHHAVSAAGLRLAETVKNGGVAAAWTLIMALFQAWFTARAPSKQTTIPAQYVSAAVHASDPDAACAVEAATAALDSYLGGPHINAVERSAARTAFDNVLRGLVAVLENALAVGDDTAAFLCRCGRPGHQESQCTFKSTLIQK